MTCETARSDCPVVRLCMRAKINSLCLENFLSMMEQGYSKHGNPYHNLVHAADVTQTTHAIITDSGLAVSQPN